MADQRSGDGNINIAMNGPENSATASSEKWNVFRRLNKIPTLRILRKFVRDFLQLGKDDPRRITHAIKVGLALSVASLFYLTDKLFHDVGSNAIWAVMTVVVVFEFTAGATLSKGLNRAIGTLLAGTLSVFVGFIADMFTGLGERIVIIFSCFLLGTATTYLRFFPKIKRKYDYGVLIFLLTFNMVAVSGSRSDNVFRIAAQRFITIAIGFGICLITNLSISPNWAGEDLHKSIIRKMEGLAKSIEGCVVQYLKDPDVLEPGEIPEDLICQGYRNLLDSKTSEESLATFASWEPGHGKFRFRHPWKQYVKVGGTLRHLAYSVVGLHGCLNSEIQAPHFTIAVLEKPFTKVGFQVALVLRQLAESIRCMEQCPPSQILMETMHNTVEELNTAFFLQSKLLHFIQPFCYADQCSLSTGETINLNVNSIQTEGYLNHQPIQIFRVVEQNLISDQDEHQSSSGRSSEEHQFSSQLSSEEHQSSSELSSEEHQSSSELSSEEHQASFELSSEEHQFSSELSSEEHQYSSEISVEEHQSSSELSTEELVSPSRRQEIERERKYAVSATGPHSMKDNYGAELAEVLQMAAFASLIMEMVARLDHVIEAVHELGKLAGFKPYDSTEFTVVEIPVSVP